MKILVTGCGISGTVLLTRLMSSFDRVLTDNRLSDNEDIFQGLTLNGFMRIKDKSQIIVRKANHSFLFTGIIDDSTQKEQVDLFDKNGVTVVNIIRDGRDVIETKNGPYICNLWISCIDQMRKYRDTISFNVRYESLVRNPDSIQTLMAEQLGFRINHKFSEYPNFIRGPFARSIKASHELRPIDDSRVGKPIDEAVIQRLCGKQYEHFCELSKELGYDRRW